MDVNKIKDSLKDITDLLSLMHDSIDDVGLEVDKLEVEKNLIEENKELIEENSKLKKEIDSLLSQNKSLHKKIDELKATAKRIFVENIAAIDDINESHKKDKNELEHLKSIKNILCESKEGKVFWQILKESIDTKTKKENKEISENKNNSNCIKNKSKRRNSNLTIAGITKTRLEWSNEWDIATDILRYRVKHNFDNLELIFGRDLRYIDIKKFYQKYPEAVLYDTLNKDIREKLKKDLDK